MEWMIKMEHKHEWVKWLVASQTRTRRPSASISADEDDMIVQAKTVYRCSCGEIREELYEGPPEGAPQPPVPPEIAAIQAKVTTMSVTGDKV